MPARLIAYLPEQAALSRLLDDGAAHPVGRSEDCEVTLADASVSRTHAELSFRSRAWVVRDLESKNGTFVDGQRVGESALEGPCWLRFGDVHCEFEPLDQDRADAYAQRAQGRRVQSRIALEKLGERTGDRDFAQETLRAVVELAECQRGMLLLAQDDRLVVSSTIGIDPAQLRSPSFGGSVGALERALKTRQKLVINDVAADPELRARRSVAEAGLRTLLCLPLMAGGELVGMVYADSTRPGAMLTELDLEMLEAFVERVALWLAVRASDAQLTQLHNAEMIGWLDLVHAHQPSTL